MNRREFARAAVVGGIGYVVPHSKLSEAASAEWESPTDESKKICIYNKDGRVAAAGEIIETKKNDEGRVVNVMKFPLRIETILLADFDSSLRDAILREVISDTLLCASMYLNTDDATQNMTPERLRAILIAMRSAESTKV